jgi:polar amino acid transport system substrate-binding protein
MLVFMGSVLFTGTRDSNVCRLIEVAIVFLWLVSPANAEERIAYFVLADTVEPIMIVRDGDPMAGGIMTEIVEMVFDDSDYVIEPKVLPWQRMRAELVQSENWIVHGIPGSFDEGVAYEMSELPIFPFNHVAVTMKSSGIDIKDIGDLNNRSLILIENFHYAGLDDYLAQAGDDNNIGVLRSFSPSGSLDMLRHGRGDIVIEWQARVIYNLKAAGLDFEDVEFHDATSIVPTKNVYLAFSANQSDEFRNFVNDRLRALTDSGQLVELVRKYYEPATPPKF